MIKLVLQISHVSEFSPTSWWEKQVKTSLKQLGIEVELKYYSLSNVGYGLNRKKLLQISNSSDYPVKKDAILERSWFINLLIVYTFEKPNYVGLMFDNFGISKRDGCAIFIDPIRNKFDTNKRQKVFAHVAIHEIGHAFNFCHPSKSSSDSSVMLPITRAKEKNNWLKSSCFEYSSYHKSFFLEEKEELSVPGTKLLFICQSKDSELDIIK